MLSYPLRVLSFLACAALAITALSCGSSHGGSRGSDGASDALGQGAEVPLVDGLGTPADQSFIDASLVDQGISRIPDGTPPGGPVNVLTYHLEASRAGLYTDPAFTKSAIVGTAVDTTFNVTYTGTNHAQPLYVDGGTGGRDLIFIATEQDVVTAYDAATGAQVWTKTYGTKVPLSSLPCGNINPLGITGTPVIDLPSRTLYFDEMTSAAGTLKHLVYGVSIDDGTVRTGFPVDVGARLSAFSPDVQNERGALAIVGGTLYVPYGGHYGDCGAYHGTVVGISLPGATTVKMWQTGAQGGGAWSVGGVATDGTNLYVSTGNTIGACGWMGGDAVIKLGAGPVFGGATADYFAPSDWACLDAGDTDLGSASPVVVHLPGVATTYIFEMGKPFRAYLLNAANLGGMSPLVELDGTTNGESVGAPALYTTALGTYVVENGPCSFGGRSGNLVAIKISAGTPPKLTAAWCNDMAGDASPIVTTTDGSANAVVWGMGASYEGGGGDGHLRAFDGDTGALLWTSPGAVTGGISRFQTPIVAKGRLFVAGNTHLVAYKVP